MAKQSSCSSVRSWLAGLAGALSLVALAAPAASARDNPPPTPSGNDQHLKTLQPFFEAVPADALIDPLGSGGGRATPQRSLRSPTSIGGGCQNGSAFISITGGATNGYGAVLVTPSTGATCRMDNFKVGSSGPQLLSKVSWPGFFRTGATPSFISPTLASPGAATLPQSFIITLFDNVNGEPVLIPSTPAFPNPQTVTWVSSGSITPPATITDPPAGAFTETPDATDTVPSGNPSGTFAIQNYIAKLPVPVSLTGGNCYFIEIRPTPAATLNPANLAWFWRSSNFGDGVTVARTPNGTSVLGPTPSSLGTLPGDVAFCLDVPTVSMASGLTCPVGSQMSCITASNFAGQVWDGFGAIRTSVVGAFTCADNFTTTCPMTINNVCFMGEYFATSGGFVIPATDEIRIRVYADTGGATTNGVPGALIAERTVTTAGSSDGSISRSAANVAPLYAFGGVTAQTARTFNANLSVNPIVIPAAGCYWLEIADTGNNYFSWWVKGDARTQTLADGFCQQITVFGAPYTQNTQVFNADFAWAFNLLAPSKLARSTSCVAVQPIANTVCTAAAALTLNAIAATFSHNILQVPTTTLLPPGCDTLAPNRNGAWFTVTGNGQNITISTCETGVDPRAAQTTFDTVVGVYCSQAASQSACNNVVASALNTNPFVCLTDNNNAPSSANCSIAGASAVTFPSVSGQVYYIYVSGDQAANGVVATGYFYVRATSSGTATDAPMCGSVQNCRVAIPAGSQAENEACGAAANNTCTTPETLALNQWATGTCNGTSGGARDADFWLLPDAGSTSSDGGTWYTIDFRSEFPPDFTWYRSPCVNGGNAAGVISTGIPQCQDAQTFNIFIPAGSFYLRVRSASPNTLPCDPLGRGNRYVLRVREAYIGACCVTGSVCAITVARDGQGLASDPTDCSQRGGVYLGDGVTCSGMPDNSPCAADGGVVMGTTTGSCCNAFGVCYVSSNAALTCADGVFTAAGACTAPVTAGNAYTCTVTPASGAASRCCFADGTCIVIDPAQCTGQGGTVQPGTACVPNSCAQPAIGACCDGVSQCFLSYSQDCPVSGIVTFIPGATSCTSPSNPCPATIPCCTATGTCTAFVPAACTGTGVTIGSGTACPPTTPCPPVTQVCCSSLGTCSLVPIGTDGSACTTGGGTLATASACPPTPNCAQPTSVCCAADGLCSVLPIGSNACTGSIVMAATCAGVTCPQPTTCCRPDGSCDVVLVGGSCIGGTSNTASTCTAANCPQPTVCCRGSTCSVEFPSDCTALGNPGIVGTGGVCNTAPDSCKVACCTLNMGCQTVTTGDCDAASGIAAASGLGTACSPTTDCTRQACCFCGSSACSFTPAANCTSQNGQLQAVGSVCGATIATNPCALPIACCNPDGTCTQVAAGASCAAGSTDSGSQTCPPAIPCAQPSVCCLSDGSCQVVLVGGTCNGTTGTGTSCPPSVPCPQPTTCCLPNGHCVQILIGGTSCAAQGGTPGTGSTCPANNTCPGTACCFGNSCAYFLDGANPSCGQAGGVPISGSCSPNPCAPSTVFCCRGTTCASVASGSCTGTVGNSASLTVGTCGPHNQISRCCFADYDHSGTSTIDDLFIYINTWLVASPYTKINGNTTAAPSIDDLFIFINLWLVGCQP